VDTNTIIAQIAKTLEKNVRDSLESVQIDTQTINDLIMAAIPEPEVQVETQAGNYGALLQSLQSIRAADNQKKIIAELVHQACQGARAASTVILGTSPVLWVGPGMGLEPGAQIGSKKISIVVGNDSLIQRAIMERSLILSTTLTATERSIYEVTGTADPGQVALIPMTINGRVQGVLLVDTDEESLPHPEMISILTGVATVAIEQLPFRQKIGFSNFCDVVDNDTSDYSAPAEEKGPFEDMELAGEETADIELNDDAEVSMAEIDTADEIADDELKAELAAVDEINVEVEETVEEDPAVEIAADPAASVDDGIDAISFDDPIATSGGESLEDYARELESQLGDELDAVEPAETEEAAITFGDSPLDSDPENESPAISFVEETEDSDDTAIELDTSGMDNDIELLETPVDEESTLSDSPLSLADTSPLQVNDPSPSLTPQEPEAIETAEAEEEIPVLQAEEDNAADDSIPAEYYDSLNLSGYNLEQYDADTKKQHEKAIRFARLLVSEIKLYNEDSVKEGREKGDLLSRLKEDIQRSKLLYEQRINAAIRSNTNYFQDEMVRQLADGDPNLLK